MTKKHISFALVVGMVCIIFGTSLLFMFEVPGVQAAGTTPAVTSATFRASRAHVLVQFNMPVFANANGTGNLGCDDFTFTDGNNAGLQTYVGATCTHTAGNSWVIIEFAAQLGDSGDTADSIAPNPGSVFTVGGAVPNIAISLTSDTAAPTFTLKYKAGDDKLLITFNEPTFARGTTNPLSSGFNYTNGNSDGAGAISSYTHSNSKTSLILDLDADLIAGDVDGSGTADKVTVGLSSVASDLFDNNMMMGYSKTLGSTDTSSDSTSPTISSVEAVKDGTRILITFSEPVFTDATMASLDNADINNDLTYTDTGGGGKTMAMIPTPNHVAGNDWVMVTLSSAVTAADLNSDTIAAHVGGINTIVDTFANAASQTPVAFQDTTSPTIISVDRAVTSSQNQVVVVFSEDVTITGGPAAGASAASTITVGDMTTGCTPVGFGAFAAGNLIYKTTRNTVALSADGTTFTIALAGQTGGYRSGPATGPTLCSGIFTPDGAVSDSSANAISTGATHATIGATSVWDTTALGASQVPTGTGSTTSITLTWTALGSGREYKFFYGKTAGSGANFGGDEWGAIQDATLGTIATASTIVTGLDSNTAYYFTPYVIDDAGNAKVGTEISATTTPLVTVSTSGGGAPPDLLPPSPPSNQKIEFKDGKVVLTWIDPNVSDFVSINIFKGKNETTATTALPGFIAKGIQTYTDADFQPGDTLKYILYAKDINNNRSYSYDVLTITIPVATISPEETQQIQKPLTAEEIKLIGDEIALLEKLIKKIDKVLTLYNVQIKKLNTNKKKNAKKISAIKSVVRRINKNKAKQILRLEELKKKLQKQ